MLLVTYGTRPEWIKVKPIIDNIHGKIPFQVAQIRQHTDIGMGEAHHTIDIHRRYNRLDSIVASVLESDVLEKVAPRYVLVQGDTTSAMAMAMAAFHRQIRVIHLEAGLRTYHKNCPYPEEVNRTITSRIADIHLCPTEENRENLIKTKITGDLYVTGNTCLDDLDRYLPTSYDDHVVVTMHRRENVRLFPAYFEAISHLATNNPDLSFIMPLHPNPNVRKHKDLLKNVNVIDPVDRNKMLELISTAKLVITDSGGVQEEASFFNKRILLCRGLTERYQKYGLHLCEIPSKLLNIFDFAIKNYKLEEYVCPFGDGQSGPRIAKILQKYLGSSNPH